MIVNLIFLKNCQSILTVYLALFSLLSTYITVLPIMCIPNFCDVSDPSTFLTAFVLSSSRI